MNIYKTEQEKALFDAMWQYILDHSDLTAEGNLFVKFHTGGKGDFAKKILSRMRGIYRSYWTDELLEERNMEHYKKVQIGIAIKEVEKANRKILKLNLNKPWYKKILDKILIHKPNI